MSVLVLNAGSSTLKCSLFGMPHTGLVPGDADPVWQAHIDWYAPAGTLLRVKMGERETETPIDDTDRSSVIASLLASLWAGEHPILNSPHDIAATAHRIVHGGPRYGEPVLINDAVRAAIEECVPLAPDHQPHALLVLDTARGLLPHAPHVAVFDTGFHHTLADAAAVYAIPYEWHERGVRRYGFHGISHQHAAERTARLMRRPLDELKLITCHLGNGASLCAVRNGRSVDTSMGFTPVEGLVMGSRSGSIDPGILIHLGRAHGLSLDELDRMLHHHSGLLGLSGMSADMRDILELAAQGHARASLALDVYVHQLRRHIGAMLASLGGLDAIVFTGGVGENSPHIRSAACEPFAFAGLVMDHDKNELGQLEQDLRAEASEVSVFVLQANEDVAMYQSCLRTLAAS